MINVYLYLGCSFSSSPLNRWQKQVDAYLEALFSELRFLGKAYKGRKLNTIYVGGGTPTTLTAEQLHRLMGVLPKVTFFCLLTQNINEMNLI